ncbi:MAG: sulfoxide reductase heme-binding subunit YedZ [Magnetococcales bacterium]|nr:sulfoxide reductase heme-binding subunit YedZ [Magnetococcales bacterium]
MRLPNRVGFALGLLPLVWLVHGAVTETLGANPIERIIRMCGDWALWLLLLTLSITPLRRLTGWGWLGRLRRMLGLFSFFYALLHLLGYTVLDRYFDWHDIMGDIRKRPYITIGLLTFLLLLPLAITSTQGWIKRLGPFWRTLHRLIYPAAILGVCHLFLMTKADWRLPALHGMVLALLLGMRVFTASTGSRTPSSQGDSHSQGNLV